MRHVIRTVLAGAAGLMIVGLAAAAAPAGLAAQGPDRRAHLEEAVRARFLEMAAARLELDAGQRQRLTAVLDEGADARRQLLRESVRLRQRLLAAARDPETPSSTFEALLREMATLTEREHALERREQERLAAFLDPRQRVMFLMMRMRFNDQVRELRGRRPPG